MRDIKERVSGEWLGLGFSDLRYMNESLRLYGFSKQGRRQWFLDNKGIYDFEKMVKWAREDIQNFFEYYLYSDRETDKYLTPGQQKINRAIRSRNKIAYSA